MESKSRILYIVYWGATEPLGRSLVLPAVKRLANLGASLTLVTFEKRDDLAKGQDIAEIAADLKEHGIEWVPLHYHKTPKVPATAYDIARGVAAGLAVRLRTTPHIIHARTFIGGLIGLTLSRLLGARLIYHNEGFYPDEQVDAGVWASGSVPHRIAKRLELTLYSRADGIIAASNRGREVIEHLPAVRRKSTPVIVVPSCVDLDRFQVPPGGGTREHGLRLVYCGSVGGRYRLQNVARFAAVAAEKVHPVTLRVLTRSDRAFVEALLRAGGLGEEQWSVDSIAHSEIPDVLSRYDAGVHFLAQGISDHGGSPTKVGEYLAAGLPVVVTPNLGDADAIIRKEGVGVLVDDWSEPMLRKAVEDLQTLLQDPALASRCRAAAEMYYSLQPACERQIRLYEHLSSRPSAIAPGSIPFDWATVDESGHSAVLSEDLKR